MARKPRSIDVWCDWHELKAATRMGVLRDEAARGKEVFSFEYDPAWLASGHAQTLDPTLGLFRGRQYLPDDLDNFRFFLDSSPDRWGRTLMDRREAQRAREEGRKPRSLLQLDYLLGVYDGHRMGALRFRCDDGPFLDDDARLASPPWTSLRDLEQASLALEQDDAEREPGYARSLRMLIAPGSSLGGARPKASVLDARKQLWIAKFPSREDRRDIGAWERVVHTLAAPAGLSTAESTCQRFAGKHHTFLTRRFDRAPSGGRIHFASAMTLLQHGDGDRGSYLELAPISHTTGFAAGRRSRATMAPDRLLRVRRQRRRSPTKPWIFARSVGRRLVPRARVRYEPGARWYGPGAEYLRDRQCTEPRARAGCGQVLPPQASPRPRYRGRDPARCRGLESLREGPRTVPR
jgi:serine/threonine-protein kinase HipA